MTPFEPFVVESAIRERNVITRHGQPLTAGIGPERARPKSDRGRPTDCQSGVWPASPPILAADSQRLGMPEFPDVVAHRFGSRFSQKRLSRSWPKRLPVTFW